MSERKRLLLLIAIMSVVSMVIAAITITVLYRTAFEEEKERLVETARSQARLIEAVARFDADRDEQVPGVYPEGAVAATLSQIEDAHRHYRGFGETGEFTLARREGDQIVFLLRHRHDDLERPEPVRFDSDLAEPMRRALSGASGTVVGQDYRGVKVLAAHEPVAELSLGIVAKIDLEEIREPFVKASFIAVGAALAVVLVGAGLFLRVSEPLIRRLEERANGLAAANEQLAREIDKRGRAEENLRKAHEELERRVEERTADLSKINEFLKQEVQERKRAVEKNKKQSEFLQNILDSITHPFYVIDVEGYIIKMANSASEVDPKETDAPCYRLLHQRDSPCGDAAKVCPVEVVKRTKRPVMFEHVHYDAEGNGRDIEVHGYPIFDENGDVSQIIEYNLDITERKRIEEKIIASAKEKEVLLREIHHRVKNNLQVVASLLNLQSDKIEDEKTREVFKDSRNRIRSMALIHEKMYQSKDLARVDFVQYLTDLVSGLPASLGISENVSLKVDISGGLSDIDTASSCGLIVNELVSNSMKYAFPEGQAGEIVVSFAVGDDGSAVLTVSDDGVGFPEDLNFKETGSLGLQLVNTLSDQIDGELRLIKDGGTTFEITFDIAKEDKGPPTDTSDDPTRILMN